jgi:hypothetical protein
MAALKERPILFSGAMVRALLDGSKTQTRREVKLQVQHDDSWVGGWKIVHKGVTQALSTFNQLGGKPLGSDAAICPYGQPGDRLWVRETFCDLDDGEFEYRADGECDPNVVPRWTPSIHMPRAASRILLEIVSVRVERLQEISAADCRAEGIAQCDGIGSAAHMINLASRMSGAPSIDLITYATLWEVINGFGSWATNPWVWVVEFKRICG